MAVYRVCRTFTIESGHMLSKHPERCRFPHGHTRRIEVVLAGKELDQNDMLVDFKAMKLALEEYLDLYDHSMAMNSADPMRPTFEQAYPEGVMIFEDTDPTTEVLARDIYDFVAEVMQKGWKNGQYRIPARRLKVERVRVWETDCTWAEYESDGA